MALGHTLRLLRLIGIGGGSTSELAQGSIGSLQRVSSGIDGAFCYASMRQEFGTSPALEGKGVCMCEEMRNRILDLMEKVLVVTELGVSSTREAIRIVAENEEERR